MSPRGAPTVGLDYTAGPGHAPGVGRYVRELVRALVRLEDAPSLRLVEFGRAPRPMEGPPLGLEGPGVRARFERIRIGVPRRLLGPLDPLVRLGATRGTDLFHRVDPGRPREVRVPASLALLEFPPAGSAAEAELRAAARAATGVITFSRAAAERARRTFDLGDDAVHLAPVGCEHWVRAVPTVQAPRPTRDVLVLGAIRRSRRPLDVLRAFEALHVRLAAQPGARPARLLLVGRPSDAAGPFREALGSSPAAAHVRWVEDPVEERMPRCVAGAACLLHLAEDEVSPVTPLEAARMGLPVVASDLPAFAEVLGPELRAVDPSDPASVARALADALDAADDPGERARLAALATPYTWETSAHAHVRAWRSMLPDTDRGR